jgi:hypothetical protein
MQIMRIFAFARGSWRSLIGLVFHERSILAFLHESSLLFHLDTSFALHAMMA